MGELRFLVITLFPAFLIWHSLKPLFSEALISFNFPLTSNAVAADKKRNQAFTAVSKMGGCLTSSRSGNSQFSVIVENKQGNLKWTYR